MSPEDLLLSSKTLKIRPSLINNFTKQTVLIIILFIYDTAFRGYFFMKRVDG